MPAAAFSASGAHLGELEPQQVGLRERGRGIGARRLGDGAELADRGVDRLEPLAARAHLGAQRRRALVQLGDEPGELLAGAPRRGRLGLGGLGGLGGVGERLAELLDGRAEHGRALAAALDLAAHRRGLLADAAGVLAGGRGGLLGGGGLLAGAERLLAGALELAAGDLELTAQPGDGGTKLVDAGGAGVLRGTGERGDLLDALAHGADVGEHAAGAAIDLVDARGDLARGLVGALGLLAQRRELLAGAGDLVDPRRDGLAGGGGLAGRQRGGLGGGKRLGGLGARSARDLVEP